VVALVPKLRILAAAVARDVRQHLGVPRRELEDLLHHFHRTCRRIPDARQRWQRADGGLGHDERGLDGHRVRRNDARARPVGGPGRGAVLVLSRHHGRRRTGDEEGEGKGVQS